MKTAIKTLDDLKIDYKRFSRLENITFELEDDPSTNHAANILICEIMAERDTACRKTSLDLESLSEEDLGSPCYVNPDTVGENSGISAGFLFKKMLLPLANAYDKLFFAPQANKRAYLQFLRISKIVCESYQGRNPYR